MTCRICRITSLCVGKHNRNSKAVPKECRKFKTFLYQIVQGTKPLQAAATLLTQQYENSGQITATPHYRWDGSVWTVQLTFTPVSFFTVNERRAVVSSTSFHVLSHFPCQTHGLAHLDLTWLGATYFCDMPKPTQECVIITKSLIHYFLSHESGETRLSHGEGVPLERTSPRWLKCTVNCSLCGRISELFHYQSLSHANHNHSRFTSSSREIYLFLSNFNTAPSSVLV